MGAARGRCGPSGCCVLRCDAASRRVASCRAACVARRVARRASRGVHQACVAGCAPGVRRGACVAVRAPRCVRRGACAAVRAPRCVRLWRRADRMTELSSSSTMKRPVLSSGSDVSFGSMMLSLSTISPPGARDCRQRGAHAHIRARTCPCRARACTCASACACAWCAFAASAGAATRQRGVAPACSGP
eukprot:3301756-Prymnesium_polylepis.1